MRSESGAKGLLPTPPPSASAPPHRGDVPLRRSLLPRGGVRRRRGEAGRCRATGGGATAVAAHARASNASMRRSKSCGKAMPQRCATSRVCRRSRNLSTVRAARGTEWSARCPVLALRVLASCGCSAGEHGAWLPKPVAAERDDEEVEGVGGPEAISPCCGRCAHGCVATRSTAARRPPGTRCWCGTCDEAKAAWQPGTAEPARCGGGSLKPIASAGAPAKACPKTPVLPGTFQAHCAR
mmetsp:Transcript_44218/g.127777  ORF Transcript_44218/g.127777 Transcript_44218/m.127777 type:complete len:239 (+) Transcript_44218:1169-1885(+)